MAQQDLVLEASGAFERHRDGKRLWGWLAVAAALFIVSALAVVNFDAIVADSTDYEGRRAGLRGLVGPAAVGIPLLLGLSSIATAFQSSARWRDRSTGEVLQLRLHGPIFKVAAEAGEVHQRFSTGDPRVYLPIEFGKHGEVGFALHVTPGARRAFVSITAGTGKRSRPLPLIVLDGGAFAAIEGLQSEAWQRGPSPQTISSFLDPLLR
ncbi:hypothetical protein [Agrococcus sp. KRD186]|jgi:hypothetical protein|uniref:hypothetical protein n=1 Tax=Agrococcus sp. KRD186 TaxID=2729730 RepID=UPI0019CF5370|nr:hypothetical protein [Agrococcus sp. KRD186]